MTVQELLASLNPATMSSSELIEVLIQAITLLQDADEPKDLRFRTGIDTDLDGKRDVTITSPNITITNPVALAILALAVRILDSIDSNPGDGVVEFKQRFKVKFLGIFSKTVEASEMLMVDPVRGE